MRFPVDAADAAADTATTSSPFPGPRAGGVYALTYPATALGAAGEPVEPSPPVQLFVHGGGWRVAAKQYGRWLRQGLGIASRSAPAWLDRVQSKDSMWVPDSIGVAANKAAGTGLTSFEDLYEHNYAGNRIDMLELAMWWEGVNCRSPTGEPLPDWTCGYGAFGADGVFAVRSDLGGIAAMRKGVEKIHKMGRRIQLYVSADIVQINNSTFFNSSWPWQRWADWPTDKVRRRRLIAHRSKLWPHRWVSTGCFFRSRRQASHPPTTTRARSATPSPPGKSRSPSSPRLFLLLFYLYFGSSL